MRFLLARADKPLPEPPLPSPPMAEADKGTVCGSVSASVFATLPKFDEFLFYSFVPQPQPPWVRPCLPPFLIPNKLCPYYAISFFIYFTFYASFATCLTLSPSASLFLVPLVVLVLQHFSNQSTPSTSPLPLQPAYFTHLNAGPWLRGACHGRRGGRRGSGGGWLNNATSMWIY